MQIEKYRKSYNKMREIFCESHCNLKLSSIANVCNFEISKVGKIKNYFTRNDLFSHWDVSSETN